MPDRITPSNLRAFPQTRNDVPTEPPDGTPHSGCSRPAERKALAAYGQHIFNAWSGRDLRTMRVLKAQYGLRQDAVERHLQERTADVRRENDELRAQLRRVAA